MKYLKLDNILDTKGIDFEYLRFNGGESQIKIIDDVRGDDVMIECLAMNEIAPMLILLARDALLRLGALNIELLLPYVPYGRQDRVCNKGEALSIKVFGELLWGSFSRVWVLDPHSPTTVACIDNCFEINRDRILTNYLADKHHMVLIAPDAGALKKILAIGKQFGMQVIEASKIRDTVTGNITGVKVHDDVAHMDCVVIDDICDGGRSFVELGKKLKAGGAVDMHLYISHGIFSMGMYGIDIYDTVTCTTNKRKDLPLVKQIKLRKDDLCL